MTASLRTLVAISATIILSSCGWVDSTGVQTSTVEPPGANSITMLANGQAISLLEEQTATTILTGAGSDLKNWVWTARNGNATDQCIGVNGFDASLAKTSLSDACTNLNNCNIEFHESSENSSTQLNISMPTLSSPLALNYELSATREDGLIVSRQQFLCGIAINEAPLANDDSYQALRNESLVVNGQDADNLLANDSDDVDLRNKQLHVLETAVQPPAYAAQLLLSADGGFVYQPIENVPLPDNGYLEDKFVYAVSDGLHTVHATAIVKIVRANDAPIRIQRIADLELVFSDTNSSDNPLELNLNEYFSDPDNDTLSFELESDQLPQNDTISLNSNGLLSINAATGATGSWQLSVIASDGLETSSDVFRLTIIDGNDATNNDAPTVSDIRNRSFSGNFSYDVSGYFDDANGDTLTFTAVGLPSGVSISSRGVISGVVNSSNSGRWFVRVTAVDLFDEAVTDGFRLTLR